METGRTNSAISRTACRLPGLLVLLAVVLIGALVTPVQAGSNVFSVKGKKVYLNGNEFKVIGLRCSNALISDADVKELIDNLDVFKSYGVNTVSVFFMGSRFGDVKGYRSMRHEWR